MTIHGGGFMNTQMQEILDAFNHLGPIPVEKTTPEVARQLPFMQKAIFEVLNEHAAKRLIDGVIENVEAIEHRSMPGPRGPILARIYHPEVRGAKKPVLLYFHGGGFVLGSLDAYDATCRALTNLADCIVVSVAYRQAPEHKYPAAREDAFAAYEWLLRNARDFGGNPKLIAVAGESAGGNLATLVCLMAREKGLPQPLHQLLVYPWVDSKMDTASYVSHQFAKPLNAAAMKWFMNHYLASPSQALDPMAFPLRHDNLSGLAPATIFTAEIDPLCSEGKAYAEKLRQFGVPVHSQQFNGVTHEFFGLGAVLVEAEEALRIAGENLQIAFEGLPIDQDLQRTSPEDELAILQMQMRL